MLSSEIKALLTAGSLDGGVNARAIDEVLAFNYTIGPHTAFSDEQKLMPGHRMTVSASGTRLNQYWDFADIQPTAAGFDECYERMVGAIDDAVRVRLMSEVPLGAFLSGGVDSSLIVAIMTKLTERPVETFTVGYEDAPGVSELEFARSVAAHVGANHHEFILRPRTFVDTVGELVWDMDEPMGDYTTIPLLLISRLAKKHVTVMLSGEGADEVFAGYSIYRYMVLVERYRSLPRWLREGFGDPLLRAALGHRKEGKYAAWPAQRLQDRYRGNGVCFTDAMRRRLVTDEFAKSVGVRRVPGQRWTDPERLSQLHRCAHGERCPDHRGTGRQRLPVSAKFSGSLDIDYRFPVAGGATGFLGLTTRYTGDRNAGYDDSLQAPLYLLSGYNVIDGRVGVQFGDFGVQLFVKNGANEAGEISADMSNTTFNPTAAARVALIQPRTFGLQLTYDFSRPK